MPKRDDIKSVLVIGSGPIIIGQACEFDYSGTQACRVLKAEGIRVVLVNSNPATIMTDPEFADATYVEPITPEFVEKVIAKERPDALLATLGGQTALNCAMALDAAGVLEKYGVELIGASHRGDRPRREPPDRSRGSSRSSAARWRAVGRSATRIDDCLGGRRRARLPGGGAAQLHHGRHRLRAWPTTRTTCAASPAPGSRPARPPRCSSRSRSSAGRSTSSRSCATREDNVVIVCSIENLDPMGVHTGDSITVAPAMTLTDREYQQPARPLDRHHPRGRRRHRRLQHPVRGQPAPTAGVVVIEMNPRVSRSSALASQGDRLPDRQDRGQGRDRLHPRRDPQRHHHPRRRAEHAGALRADARLRRGEGAAVRVREVPRRRPDADHAHEVGRRGDGDRPQLHRGAAEGAALAGEPDARLRLAPGVGRARQGRAARGDPRSRTTAG